MHKLRDAVEEEGIAIVAAGIARAIHQGADIVVPRDIRGRTARLVKRPVGHEIAGDVRVGLARCRIPSQFIQEIFKITIAVRRDEGAIGGIVWVEPVLRLPRIADAVAVRVRVGRAGAVRRIAADRDGVPDDPAHIVEHVIDGPLIHESSRGTRAPAFASTSARACSAVVWPGSVGKPEVRGVALVGLGKYCLRSGLC